MLNKSFATVAVPAPLVTESGTTVRLSNSYQINSPFTSVTMLDSNLLNLNGCNECIGLRYIFKAKIGRELTGARILVG